MYCFQFSVAPFPKSSVFVSLSGEQISPPPPKHTCALNFFLYIECT